MIGLGLSLCGACVMVDSDDSTEKPVYTSEHTRGYYIADATRALRASPSFALYTMLDSATFSEIVQRGVVFSENPIAGDTLFSIWTDDVGAGFICRNLYFTISDAGRATAYIKTYNYARGSYSVSHLGVFDGIWNSSEATFRLKNAIGELRYSAPVYESQGKKNFIYHTFVNNDKMPEDALFKMAYTKKNNKYTQLVYPLSCVRCNMESVSINLVDYQKIEL